MDPSGTREHRRPPGQGWPPAGSESCVVQRSTRLRSVDSECAGRVMEPRNNVVGADAVAAAEGNTNVLEREDAQGPARRSRRGPRAGHVHEGSPGTWEALPPKIQRMARRAATRAPKSRMREICTSGSVGPPAGDRPGLPDADERRLGCPKRRPRVAFSRAHRSPATPGRPGGRPRRSPLIARRHGHGIADATCILQDGARRPAPILHSPRQRGDGSPQLRYNAAHAPPDRAPRPPRPRRL